MNKKYTLEDIVQRKQEVLQDIRIQHQVISENTQTVFAPFMPSANEGKSSFFKSINTGMAIFDGVLVGMKVFRSFRRFFRRR